MTKYLMPVLLGLAIFCMGCVPSLHPLYTNEDVVFDAALLGEWQQKGEDELWRFARNDKNNYHLMVGDTEDDQGEFVVHLVELEGHRFLDLYPEEPECVRNDFYKMHLLGVHSFIRLRQIEPTLEMALMEADWLAELLEQNPKLLRHEIVDGRLVLSAPSEKLQHFILSHCLGDEAWGDYTNLTRIAGE